MKDPTEPLSETEFWEQTKFATLRKTSTTLADSLEQEIAVLMDAMGIEALFISDESKVSDFGSSEPELARIRRELGIEIDRKDYIVDVALRLSGRTPQ